MAIKKKSVDSIVDMMFDEAADVMNKPLTKSLESTVISQDQGSITPVSPEYQSSITLVSPKDQGSITPVSPEDQRSITLVSPKDQGGIRVSKSITPNPTKKLEKVASIRLSEKQSLIYSWFLENGASGEFNRGEIERATKIKGITIRKSLSRLESLGIIKFFEFNFSSNTRDYKLNSNIPVRLHKRITLISPEDQGSITSVSPPLNSSSSLLLNKTDLLTRVTCQLDSDPELNYWKQKSLRGTKVESWINKFQISFEDIIQSLRHCAFEMIETCERTKKGKGDPIKDVFDWFHNRLATTAYYERPTGYKTRTELATERAVKRNEDLKKELAALQKAQEEGIGLEAAIWYMKLSQEEQAEVFKGIKGLSAKDRARPDINSPRIKALVKQYYREIVYKGCVLSDTSSKGDDPLGLSVI